MRISAIAFAAALTLTGTASAATGSQFIAQVQNGAGACQPARSSNGGNIRNRPLGLSNEGTTPVFVTCSLKADDTSIPNHANGLQLSMSSGGTATVNVNCTLVTGGKLPLSSASDVYYFPKSFAVSPGSWTFAAWETELDNGGNPFINTLNWSCNLPPGVEINFVFTTIPEEVGA